MNKKMFTKTTAMLLAAAVVASGIPANETEAAKSRNSARQKFQFGLEAAKKLRLKMPKKSNVK